MKLQSTDHTFGKQQSRRKSPKIFPLIILTLFLTIITIYYPSLTYHTIYPKKLSVFTSSNNNFNPSIKPAPHDTATSGDDPKISQNEAPTTNLEINIVEEKKTENPQRNHNNNNNNNNKQRRGRRRRRHDNSKAPAEDDGGGGSNNRLVESWELMDKEECNLFSGEWVRNLEAPYYTNQTCFAIQEHQNCMKFGRPDSEFLKWKWKPDGCDLQVFDPHRFLKLVTGKSLAFVGDSVARNHMQSLICLLSTVAVPVTVSSPFDQNQRHEYRDFNFTMSIFWAPYLVRVEKTDAENVNLPFNLYLDEFDEDWRSQIPDYDYVIISGGQWFFRPTNFFLNRRFVGCLYCSEENVTHYGSAAFSYRRAFRTALRAIYSAENFKGLTVLRTYATSHFENGRWDAGGDCERTEPYKRNEAPAMEDYSVEMYSIQLQEFQIAEREAKKRGLRFRLFDATKPMFLRPDGHPSKYGHWPPKENVTMANDCVHWCLPGPIDTLNDFLLELMRREEVKDTSVR